MRKLLIAFGLISASALGAYTTNDNMNEWERRNFLETLQGELNKQQTLVNNIKQQAARRDVVNTGDITTQFENAYIMLNVKKTLFENFKGTPSIESPLIQEKLLQIFRKTIVTPGDLAELDALVKQERPKYAREPQSAAYTSAAAPANNVQPVSPAMPVTPVAPAPALSPGEVQVYPKAN